MRTRAAARSSATAGLGPAAIQATIAAAGARRRGAGKAAGLSDAADQGTDAATTPKG